MEHLCCRRGWMLMVMLLASPGVSAESDEARLKRERQEIDQRHARAVEACQREFAATACLDRARAERRAALDGWRQQRLVIDDAKRRMRAAQRLQDIQARNAEIDSRIGSNVEPSASAATSPRRRDAAVEPPASAASDARAAQAIDQAAKASAQRRQREREAAEHRAKVEKRNAESAARRPSAPGLPVPSAASAVSPAARP